MEKTPGQIHTEKAKAACYERYPDLDDRVVELVTQWQKSVPIGTVTTVSGMLNHANPGRHGIPLEVARDFLLLKYSGVGPVEGIRLYRSQLSPEEEAAGWASVMFIQNVPAT